MDIYVKLPPELRELVDRFVEIGLKSERENFWRRMAVVHHNIVNRGHRLASRADRMWRVYHAYSQPCSKKAPDIYRCWRTDRAEAILTWRQFRHFTRRGGYELVDSIDSNARA